MELYIIGGFLGSGKTTLLLSLARYLVEKYPECACAVAVIENEIGTVPVDDVLLRHAGAPVTTLFSGCVCCSLSGELSVSLHQIWEQFHPRAAILEVSGLGFPGRIATLVRRECKVVRKIHTIAICNAQKWLSCLDAMETMMTNQLEGADLLLMNKIDLVTEKTVEEIKTSLQRIRPEIQPVPVTGTAVTEKFWEILEDL